MLLNIFLFLQTDKISITFANMRHLWLIILFSLLQLSAKAQSMMAEDYYISAFNEMSDMLAGKDSLSIKRAVFLAEWAYYEGKLDYKTDFCDEIDRIVKFVRLFCDVNKLQSYKTRKQIALSSYFHRPLSGNGYNPYTYDFDALLFDDENWENQFVSKTLKTHKGQCHSLPWMYKILAIELGADVSLAHAPRHCYIMYKDEDKITPEEWVNLEVTTNQMNPAWWIKQHDEICDSALIVGTYMTPLTDIQTVACQMADLAFGYWKKFHRYDNFTFYCTSRSLEFYPMNPNALIIRGKSLDNMIQNHLIRNGNIIDDYTIHLVNLLYDTKYKLDHTYMIDETDEIRERRIQEAMENQKRHQEKMASK